MELKKAKIKEDTLKDIYAMAVRGCQEMYGVMRKSLLADSLKSMLIF